jgi:coenzyme F420-reducing hydrogenase alpha subunit
MVRVVDPDGKEFCKYKPSEYLEHISEHTEIWSYLKYPYLKKIGWKGFVSGKDSGVYRATPLSRLNASDGMATPLAQAEYEKYYETLTGDRSGKKPFIIRCNTLGKNNRASVCSRKVMMLKTGNHITKLRQYQLRFQMKVLE